MSFLLPAIAYQWPLRIHSLATGRDVVITLQNGVVWNALGFVGLWMLVFSVTAWGVVRLLQGMPKNKMSSEATTAGVDPKPVWRLYTLSSVIGSLIAAIHALIVFPSTLEQIVHQLSLLPICAMGLGIYLAANFRRELSRFEWGLAVFLLVLAMACVILLPLLTGWAAPVAYGMLTVVFLLIVFRSRMTVPFIFIAVVATIFAMVTKSEVREWAFNGSAGFERVPIAELSREGWSVLHTRLKEPPKQYGVSERMRAFGESDPNYQSIRWMAPDRTDWLKYVVARVVHRMNHLGELTYVMEKTPAVIPYSGMTTYLPVFYVAIPRALMPGKPANETGQYFGHRYSFVWPEDTWTAANLSVVVEGYMSAGVWGVAASAAFFAVFCMVAWMGIVEKADVLGVIFVGAPLLANVLNSESGFAFIVGGGIHALLVYGLLIFVIRFLMSRGARKELPAPVAKDGV